MRRTVILTTLFILAAAAALARWLRVRERAVDVARHRSPPPEPDPSVSLEGVQPIAEGAGPFFHRRYRADLEGCQMSARDLADRVLCDLPAFVPEALAKFRKTRGEPGQVELGDEFDITIAGPWNGGVRVVRRDATSCTLATLRGHPEAGLISFSVAPIDGRAGALRFEIESWARSRDGSVRAAYKGGGKAVQRETWVQLCEHVAEASGGRQAGKVDVLTERQPEDAPASTPAAPGRGWRRRRPARPLYEVYRRQLEALADAPVNFDYAQTHEHAAERGWRVDDFEAELPPEEPGQPAERGAFAAACRVLREYRFPDPKIVTGIFVPDRPLEGRVMLLRARAYGMTFFFGVKVARVVDEERDGDGGRQRAWGYSYQTLRGHYERGQMDFLIVKWLETGRVAFQIHAVSQAGQIANPVMRIGFRLLGRRVQMRFVRRALERMRQLVAEDLAGARGSAVPEAPDVRAPSEPEAARELGRLQQRESAGPPLPDATAS